MRKIIIFFLLSCMATQGFSAEKRDILQKEANEVGLANVLIKDFSETGLPNYKDRDFWDKLPEDLKKQYIIEAEAKLDYDWPVIKATDYLEIIRSGDRKQGVYSAPRSALTALVMGELVEGKGRFIDQIINGAWYYSEQTWWGWSAHLPAPKGLPDIDKPTIDLGVGEVASILSWTWHLFHDKFDEIHPLISKRLKDEIMKKAIVPYYERDDFFWMGLNHDRSVNNWNPWINHNMLTAILLLEDDQEKKNTGVQKVIRSLDVFLNQYPTDGGCDEGSSYWGKAGASMYEGLKLLKMATNAKFNVFDNELVKNIGTYIYKVNINYPYFINFADANAKESSRPQIIYSYGKDIQDTTMQKFGAYLAKLQDWGAKISHGKIDEQITQLMLLDEIKNAPAENALISDFYLPDIEVAGARDKAGSTEGFFFAAKGGHNAESHNHNDLGSCVLYFDGKPCLIDIGHETYVDKTFSSRRYEIWTLQSQYHNLPQINGIDQMQGRQYEAKNTTFSADAKKAVFSTNISEAYTEEAGVEKWVRRYRLDRGKKFTISDSYEYNELGKNPTTLNFISSCKVTELAPGVLNLEGDGFKMKMEYNAQSVSPVIEFNEVTDRKLKRYWPDGITRIVFTVINPSIKGENTIEITELK
jgi:hypothetical protein